MTGTVSWETLLWVLGSNAAVLIVGWRVVSWLQAELKQRDLGIEAVNARAKLAEDKLEDALISCRQYVAENSATKDGVDEGFARVERSIDEVKGLIHQMLLDRRPTRAPPRRVKEILWAEFRIADTI